MTASSAGQQQAASCRAAKHTSGSSVQPSAGYLPANNNNNNNNGPSSVFSQVKQTQSSLARLSRAQQHITSSSSQTNQSSQSASNSSKTTTNESSSSNTSSTTVSAGQAKSNTFLDCLNRRFRDCFSEDFCTVPVFVVGNLSPGSDGTHLILPPCVSLCRQNINRFASPKNLRLMNSIRESCKSIEQLDLGGNKLTDLIEVFKILQSTPNLKFLNLSENDLSKSAPVAMASTSNCLSSSTTSTTSFAFGSPHFGASPYLSSPSSSNNWSSSSIALNNSPTSTTRTCLAPINQNHQMGSRRHSSLGQSSSSISRSLSQRNSTRANATTDISSANETIASSSERVKMTESTAISRTRLASAALAQSKKTSSTMATKLTSSAAASQRVASSNSTGVGNSSDHARGSNQRHHGSSSSTMQLARSLSSLSAKDIRATSSIGRLSQLRASSRQKDQAGSLRRSSTTLSGSKQTSTGISNVMIQPSSTSPNLSQVAAGRKEQLPGKQQADSPSQVNAGPKAKVGAQKLFAEPMAETDHDVDMNDSGNNQQQSIPGSTSNAQVSNHIHNHHHLQQQQQQQHQHNQQHNHLRGGFLNSRYSTSSGNNYRRTFESIKGLALNNTGCQWKVVCSILNRMPNLEELHLSLNNYASIDLDPIEFKHLSLKKLYLCNNPKLTDWQELDKLLLAFPSLEALSIADCNISQIPENLANSRGWRKLCGLNINGWPIKEWPVVERLNQLPSLIDLRCRNLEVLNSIDEPRHHLIARLPKLQRLNGSEIEEREHAEKVFLRFFMANSHLERPTRFHELLQIHGEVIPVDVDVDLSPPQQASIRVVHLNRNYFKKDDDILMSEDFLNKLMDHSSVEQQACSSSLDCMEIDSSSNNNRIPSRLLFKDEGQEIIAIDVDLRQSIRKFKSILSQIFGLNSQNMILYYIDHEMIGLMGPELIKHNQKKLWNYNVRDGDQFIVEER